jgi:hypothetical protein
MWGCRQASLADEVLTMPVRRWAVIGLTILACLAIIALSAQARSYFAAAFGPLPFKGILDGLARFGRRPPLPLDVFRHQLAGWRVFVSAVAGFVFLYLAGLLTLFALPGRLRTLQDALDQRRALFPLLGIGAIGAVALLLLTLLGFFTVTAFPLPLVLPVAILGVVWMGAVALALTVGRAIGRWSGAERPAPLQDLALGTLVLFSLGHVPFIGWAATVLFGAIGLGAMISTRLGTGRPWSLDEYFAVRS